MLLGELQRPGRVWEKRSSVLQPWGTGGGDDGCCQATSCKRVQHYWRVTALRDRRGCGVVGPFLKNKTDSCGFACSVSVFLATVLGFSVGASLPPPVYPLSLGRALYSCIQKWPGDSSGQLGDYLPCPLPEGWGQGWI